MATLILTAAGTAIGGPLGGVLGAIIGQQFDQNILFRPKGREGPRLQELAVQTSSYGSQIPRIYGKMRVAGTVVWATDLKESRSRQDGGKGRPSTTVYSYSACFAVALSSREIKNIGRIWADGKIFRGAAGDFKTGTRFAFHHGREDQPVDGLMASAEANGGTPAYRGLALAVFEDMDLTEYGNRIPSLTFEVMADDDNVTIAQVVADVSGRRIALPPGDAVIGFAAGGRDRQVALRSLTDSIPLSFSSDPSRIDHIVADERSCIDAESAVFITSDFVHTAGKREIAQPENHTAAVGEVPRQISVRYYDPARDYQSGIQSAFRPGTGRKSSVREIPATIAADTARAIAETALWTAYGERSSLNVALSMSSRPLRPGMLIKFGSFDGFWNVRQCEICSGYVRLSLTRAGGNRGADPIVTDQGRNIPDPDIRAGPTRLVLVDLPFAIDAPGAASDQARLYAAAAGDAGWRNAQLFKSGPGGSPGPYVGQIAASTVMGVAVGALDIANPALFDRINHIDVEMHNPAMTLAYANDSELLGGRNVAMIGREFIQFAEAMPLGAGRYRLSRLIRGLGGTEAEIAQHDDGEDFVLLDAGSLLEIGSAVYSPFAPTTFMALGRDDLVPVSSTIESPGRALMPWSPVHPHWEFQGDGDLQIGWIRRSRAGTIWSDHVEVPLAEEVEQYRIELRSDTAPESALSRQSSEPQANISAAEVEMITSGNVNKISVKIFQIGAFGLSDPLIFEILV